MKIARTLSALVLAGLFASTAALAADAPAAAEPGPALEACKADVQTLCAGVQPGDGRIKQCMAKNRSKLSDGCKAALKEQRGKKKAANP